ncbi:hypothetical protein AB2B38_008480 [Balneola sp. MJW-20]|uniref:hypothetical protein n=1 Tax=Gracilimonas aurantiaca TaxID=3234185 RepID=UPI00346718C4
MKRSLILSVFVCLAMSLNTFAQSDNAAFVFNKGADNCTASLFAGLNTWTGGCTYVATKSGNVSFMINATLVSGPGVEETTKFEFEQTVNGVPMLVRCVATKSGQANCNVKEL